MVHWAWDLDNTLISTWRANMAAYTELGVTPPPNFHQIPWRDWCAPSVHEAKSRRIAHYLEHLAKPTPLLHIYRQVGGWIITNASQTVVDKLVEMYSLSRDQLVRVERPEDKPAALTRISPSGLYLDDSRPTVELVRRTTAWQAVHIEFSSQQLGSHRDFAMPGSTNTRPRSDYEMQSQP